MFNFSNKILFISLILFIIRMVFILVILALISCSLFLFGMITSFCCIIYRCAAKLLVLYLSKIFPHLVLWAGPIELLLLCPICLVFLCSFSVNSSLPFLICIIKQLKYIMCSQLIFIGMTTLILISKPSIISCFLLLMHILGGSFGLFWF